MKLSHRLMVPEWTQNSVWSTWLVASWVGNNIQWIFTSSESSSDLPSEIPRAALFKINNQRSIIKGIWLVTQRPPQALIDAGGEVYDEKNIYSTEKKDPENMQCWLEDGNWYWNAKASTWLAETWYVKQWGKIDDIYVLKKITKRFKWKNYSNAMRTLWIAPVGWFVANKGRTEAIGNGILPSSSKCSDYEMQVLWFDPDYIAVQDLLILNANGFVPFISVDTPN